MNIVEGTVKSIAKKGLPGNKDGSKTTYQGENKAVNRIASAVGRGKSSSLSPDHVKAAHSHASAPLTALQDPSQFGPPPKNMNYYDESGNPKTAATSLARTGYGPTRVQPKPLQRQPLVPSRQMQITQAEEVEERPLQITQAGETQQQQRPTGGFGAARPPRSISATTTSTLAAAQQTSTALTRPKPQPPPRLPARQNEYPDEYTPPAPPAYGSTPAQADEQQEEYLNQAAVGRLGQAGVSVPGFGIGRTTAPATAQPAAAAPAGQLSELQARFARMSAPSQSQSQAPSPTVSQASPSGSGTTWTQKQQALQTAAAFRNDPSSITFSDARNAASTANNFRERHGHQVAAGWNSAQNTAQKYGVADKVNGMLAAGVGSGQIPVVQERPNVGAGGGFVGSAGNGQAQRFSQPVAQEAPPPFNNVAAAAATKKKPPPPPKKDFLVGQPEEGAADIPPPIPLSSKPRF